MPDRLGGDAFRPVANDVVEDVSNVGSMGPIHPETGSTPTAGVAPAGHPELADSHWANRLTRIADLSGESSVGYDASKPLARAAAVAPSSRLVPK